MGRYSMDYGAGWAPYVSVAERKAKAERAMAKRAKSGLPVDPIPAFRSRTIATTVWGRAWCDALEGQADLVNRLPRGKT